jgi:hypothetical protein
MERPIRPNASGTRLRVRLAAPLAAFAVLVALTLLYLAGERDLYRHILQNAGIPVFPFPFVDLSGNLAAWECARLGIDVVVADPCDVMRRGYNYAPFWMSIAFIPLGPADAGPAGWALDAVFIASLALLPPPRRGFDLAVTVAATLSCMTVYAVERANPDILIFLLALAAGLLALRGGLARGAAYLLILLAAMIKYYPITLLILTAREQPGRFVAINAAMLAALALLVCWYFEPMARGLPLIASGPYDDPYMFAAKQLPLALAAFLARLGPAATLPQTGLVAACYGLLLLAAATICHWLLRDAGWRRALRDLPPPEAMFLVIGCTLIAGCFFAGQSIEYRGIFLLFALPGLLAIGRGGVDRGAATLARWTALLILALMWKSFGRVALDLAVRHAGMSAAGARVVMGAYWCLKECCWWWCVSVMLAILLGFVMDSAAGRRVLAGVWRPAPAAG